MEGGKKQQQQKMPWLGKPPRGAITSDHNSPQAVRSHQKNSRGITSHNKLPQVTTRHHEVSQSTASHHKPCTTRLTPWRLAEAAAEEADYAAAARAMRPPLAFRTRAGTAGRCGKALPAEQARSSPGIRPLAEMIVATPSTISRAFFEAKLVIVADVVCRRETGGGAREGGKREREGGREKV